MPTPRMCPRTPNAKVSVAVKPAGSPVWRPESLSTSFKPARAFLLAEGARPNLPAKSRSVVDATTICSEHETTISSCGEKEGYVRVDTPPLEDIHTKTRSMHASTMSTDKTRTIKDTGRTYNVRGRSDEVTAST